MSSHLHAQADIVTPRHTNQVSVYEKDAILFAVDSLLTFNNINFNALHISLQFHQHMVITHYLYIHIYMTLRYILFLLAKKKIFWHINFFAYKNSDLPAVIQQTICCITNKWYI